MRDYWVLWTYEANYSDLKKVQAKSAEEAASLRTALFGPSFQKGATIYVFNTPPVYTREPSK